MPKIKTIIHQFHWKILLIRILVNAGALILTVSLIPDIFFSTITLRGVIIISIGLGILNAIVKPVLLLLTGQFIFATFGLLVIFINTLILYLLEWLFPNVLVINSFLWALIAGALISLLSNALENLLGLTPPIVPEDNQDLRQLIEAKQHATIAALMAKPQPLVKRDVDTQSVSELSAAQAALDTIQASTASVDNTQPGVEDASEPPETSPPPPDPSGIHAPDSSETQTEQEADNTPKGGEA